MCVDVWMGWGDVSLIDRSTKTINRLGTPKLQAESIRVKFPRKSRACRCVFLGSERLQWRRWGRVGAREGPASGRPKWVRPESAPPFPCPNSVPLKWFGTRPLI